MKLHFSFFIWVALIVSSTVMASDKIDEAIDLKQQSFVPVFIRMSDQVIGRAGESTRSSAVNILAIRGLKTARM